MDERKPLRPEDDDVPIIGDYSQAADARLRADEERRTAGAQSPAPPPPRERQRERATQRPRAESWALDPADVHRHAQRMKQRERKGPLRKIAPYGVAAAALAAAVAVYWNFDALRGVTIDFSGLTSLFARNSTAANGGNPVAGTPPEAVAVEAPAIVGTNAADEDAAQRAPVARAAPPPATPAAPHASEAAPTRDEADAPPADAASSTQVASAAAPAPDLAAGSGPPTPPAVQAPPPEPPPGPESFSFGVSVVHVSEAAASAAVLVLRNGDRRRASSVTWWTKDGTARAGEDYADLGKVVMKFAPGEQNRAIHIPIVSDHRAEGPETFYVYFATDEAAIAAAQPTEQVEVVIDDQG